MPIQNQHFNFLHKDSTAVLQAGVFLPEVNSLFYWDSGTWAEGLDGERAQLIDFLSTPCCCSTKLLQNLKKNLAGALLCLGYKGKNITTAASSENMAFILKCNFTSSLTDNNHPFYCNNGCLLLYPFGWPVGNNQVARKVTGNLKRQRGGCK